MLRASVVGAVIVSVCATAAPLGVAAAGTTSGASTDAGPRLFVSGALANHDQLPLRPEHANAAILAAGASGIARLEVAVDDRGVAGRDFHCRSECPRSARLDYVYRRSRFGPGAHEVEITAFGASGRRARQTISVQPPPGPAPKGTPNPQPAFYVTARSVGDLRRQTADDAARFAGSQGKGSAVLVLDFGAARHRGRTWGVSLRSGQFFSNAEVQSALQAAARAYHAEHRRGRVTIVYANSNANLGDPGRGYQPLNVRTARQAGRRQARVVRRLHLYPHESAAAGGDIEPGYDKVAPPAVSISLVAGAAAGGKPYYDIGSAPCTGQTCTNGWTVDDICAVATGGGRLALPEIYYTQPVDQPTQWATVQRGCGIEAFAGASASPVGGLKPGESWDLLGRRTNARVLPAVVVFPR